jgi:hypothetical protein
MCETMQSSHRLRPAMVLVRALLALTATRVFFFHFLGGTSVKALGSHGGVGWELRRLY